MSKAKARFRARLSEAQNHRCCYCGERMVNTKNHPRETTIDHYQAQAHGGQKHANNCVAACRECNERRGTKNPQKFWDEVRRSKLVPA